MREEPAPQGIGYTGCLLLIVLVVALFVLHGLFVYVEASINQAKWHERGSLHYTITVADISFGGGSGTLKVQNGKTVDAQPPRFTVSDYDRITVEGIFEQIRSHAFAPFSWESVVYDPVYGYPKEVRFNQWSLATDQPIGVDVDRLVLDPNP